MLVLPGGLRTTVRQIWIYDSPLTEAFCPQSITLILADDLDEASQGEGELDVSLQIGARPPLDERGGLPGRIDHVPEANPVVMLRHTGPAPRARRGRGSIG